jgi:hypothetical protein
MEKDFFYDFTDWNQKRSMLWKSIQMTGEGAERFGAWRDHSTLYKLMSNADQYAMHIQREETNCRRLRKQTTRHRKLIRTFEETVQTLEDMAIMYRLTYA